MQERKKNKVPDRVYYKLIELLDKLIEEDEDRDVPS